jgi:site-specific recombinase XerD
MRQPPLLTGAWGMKGQGFSKNLRVFRGEKYNLSVQESIDAFIEAKDAKGLAPKSLTYYRYELNRFREFLAMSDVTLLTAIGPDHIRRYLISLHERNLKPSSQHAAARAIQAWLNWHVTQRNLADSPMRYVEKPKRRHKILPSFDQEDVDALLAACQSPRETAIIYVLLDTGCRLGELVGMNRRDIDMTTGEVTIVGKGQKERRVYLNPKTRQAIKRYLAGREHVKPQDPLWVSEHGGARLTDNGLRQVLERLGERAGVPNVSPHAFRRTCVQWLYRSGQWSLLEIQALLGHESLVVIRHYIEADDSDVKEAHKRMSAIDLLK